MTESDVYVGCAFALKMKPLIEVLESFISCAKGTLGMLLNGHRAVRPPPHRRTIAISFPNYVDTALNGNPVLSVLRYRRPAAILVPRNMETEF